MLVGQLIKCVFVLFVGLDVVLKNAVGDLLELVGSVLGLVL